MHLRCLGDGTPSFDVGGGGGDEDWVACQAVFG